MPKYEIVYHKTKTKVIRASSLEVATDRATKSAGIWKIFQIKEQPSE